MKATGIIRRIDDLGRMVIPKEIRKTLNIKKNESFEIYIEEDKIILKKYNEFKNLEKSAKEYLIIFEKNYKLNIIITDLKKVVVTTKSNQTLEKQLLTPDFLNILVERKILKFENKENNWFKDYSLNNYTYIYPLIIDTELLGSIVLIDNKTISIKDEQLIKLLGDLIKNNYNNV